MFAIYIKTTRILIPQENDIMFALSGCIYFKEMKQEVGKVGRKVKISKGEDGS